MSCCDVTTKEPAIQTIGAEESLRFDRRGALKGIAGAAGAVAVMSSGLARAQSGKVRLAFCGQLLCVVPYEVTRARGHFADEGLDFELVYTRGGSAAMQALIGGAVEYCGSSFDVAIQAYARGAKIQRFASTGRLPLFALAVAPGAKSEIGEVKDLEGRTVGVSALGNADHTILLYLLTQAGADTSSVRFAALGTNLYDALRLRQVDAGMVQEPALSLIKQEGGAELVNVMDIEDARRYLGGPYEFMGVSVRSEEREARLEEMRAVARALAKGLADTRTIPVVEVIAALPKELVAGGDRAQLAAILERYRTSLYPESVAIDPSACNRAADALKTAGVLESSVEVAGLLDLAAVGG
ncbi:MAG TPA: ABC transporter substrate-binding protein [Kiloniellales bacterium]|nr:ABC transporter substrate-binding protein [Kiloniellales bacterium]